MPTFATANIQGSVSVTVQVQMKVNLAVQHMLAAARFSREVSQLEQLHREEEFGPFWETIFHFATACVLASVASLEAYANELFSDRETLFPDYPPDLLHNLWETYEQKPILEKFEFALLLLRKSAFDRGARPYQDVKVLIDLRNALTHFKPEWMNEADEHARMSRKLDSKIEGSVFLQASERLFPRRWASHSGTKWAVQSALAFAEQFEANAVLPRKYKVGDMTALQV